MLPSLGELGAARCPHRQPGTPSAAQRIAAIDVLRDRDPRITPVQRIAVIDAAARWLREEEGEQLAEALLQAACADAMTANFAYLALIEQPRPVQ